MPRWRLLLGGPLIWAAHFTAIYATSSVSHLAVGATNTTARIVTLAATLACLGASFWVLAAALRQRQADDLSLFWRAVAAAGAALAIIAIIWQTLPALAPIEGTPPSTPS